MNRKSDNAAKKDSCILSDSQATQILNQIISDSTQKTLSGTKKHSWKHLFLQNDLFKKAIIFSGIVLAFLLFLPGTIAPVPISDVSTEPVLNAASAVIDFHINSMIPLKQVSASINTKPISVTQKSYMGYSVEVKENGYLILEAETITGMTSSQNILVENLDTEAPHITNHKQSGDTVVIYLTDGEGSGVDYENITAYNSKTKVPVVPTSYSEEQKYVIFDYPEETIYIDIPDKAGNKLTSILEPLNTY